MKILALETSAKSVSAAVTENGAVLASAYQNRGLTHSVTLMPLIDGMLRTAGLSLDDIGLIAAATIAFSLALSFLLLGVISCMPAGILPEGLTPADNPPAALVGSVVGAVGVITLGMAVTLPLIFRFGMTRATRLVPVVVVIAIAAGTSFFDAGIQPTGVLASLAQWLDTGSNYLLLAIAMVAAVALVYAASALIAAKLYEKREF